MIGWRVGQVPAAVRQLRRLRVSPLPPVSRAGLGTLLAMPAVTSTGLRRIWAVAVSPSVLRTAARTFMPLPSDQSDFSAYVEIDLPSESRINVINRSGLGNQEWVAVEKVHGTNFAIYYLNETKFRYAKRSGIMNDNENFFGYHLLIPEFQEYMRVLCGALKRKYGIPPETRLGKVVLHGELFGAKYKHPLVPKSVKWCTMPNGKKFPIAGVQIQREPFPQYSPELHFFAFDVKFAVTLSETEEAALRGSEERGGQAAAEAQDVDDGQMMTEEEEAAALKFNAAQLAEDKNLQLLPYDDFVEVCSQVPGLLHAKALVRGTLDQCLAFDVENFMTPLPALLGLGNYPLEGNLAEGIVIRHVRRGDPQTEKHNVSTIIKLRCSSFMELKHPGKQKELKETFIDTVRAAAVARAKMLQKRKLGKRGGAAGLPTEGNVTDPVVPLIPDAMLPQVEAAANNLLLNNVSDGRLSNVLSKIGREPLLSGEVKMADVALMLAKDALKDFLKDIDPVVLNTSLAFRKALIRNTYFESKRLVEEKWQELLSQERAMQAEQEAAASAAAA